MPGKRVGLVILIKRGVKSHQMDTKDVLGHKPQLINFFYLCAL